MNAAIGDSAVILALGGAVIGCVTLVVGLLRGRDNLLRTGRSYTWVIVLGAVVATLALQHALITRDFTLQYVANNDSRETPFLFRITAMWSNLSGSILLWGLVLSGYIAAVSVHFRARITDPLVGWATAIMYAVAAFFFGLMATVSNPFLTVHGATPTDGPGPDPLLQNHVLVAFHPPLLYLGLVGFTIPFAFACASLITGRVGEGWLIETRRWTLFAWGFLTVGVILGAWWSYQVLGWGGYWAWDPVENAAFLPWITATAFLHSVMVQERRGMFRVWNLSLVIATFSLTILATFLTRSGVLESVHSFNNTGIGPALLAFFGVVAAAGVGLLAWRGDRLRSPGAIDSPVSREGAFLANNLLFGAFALVVLLGTVFPLIAQAVNGDQITVGAPYFNRMTMPIVVCLLFLMAVAPVLPWRKASAELLRRRLFWPGVAAVVVLTVCVAFGVRGLNPLLVFGLGAFAGASALRQLVLASGRQGWRGLVGRANGGMIVHLGVVMIAVAFAASHSYATSTQLTLKPGQSGFFDGHRFTYLGTRSVTTSTHSAVEARVQIDGGQVYAPAISDYPFASEEIGTPSVRSGPTEDVYLTFASTAAKAGDPVVIGVIVEPLVMWIWVGGGVMLLGTALSAWPGRRRRPIDPVSAPAGRRPADQPFDSHPEPAGVGAGCGGVGEPHGMTDRALRTDRRPRLVLWISLGMAVALAVLITVLATSGSNGQQSASSPLIGKPAPAIKGPSILGGPAVQLSAYTGKWVLVNFAASWCVPCRQETPQLLAFSQDHQTAHDATILTVAYDEGDVSSLAAFLRGNHSAWPAVNDGQAVVDYGIGGIPESYLVDPSGTVVAKYDGPVVAAQLNAVIARASDGTQ